MCDPISIGIIGGFGGAALGLHAWGLNEIIGYTQQEEMNSAIEKRYQIEVENARQERLALERQQTEKALQENLETHREERNAEREQMLASASAEAAMSSLNIAGNTAQRQVVADAMAETENSGAFAAKRDRIEGGFRSGVMNADRQFNNQVQSAKNTALASWRPLTGTWYNQIFGALGSTLQGGAMGISTGNNIAQSGWFATANQGDTPIGRGEKTWGIP